MSDNTFYWGTIRIRNPKTLRRWIKSGKYQEQLDAGYTFNPCCGRFTKPKCTCTKCRNNRGGSKLQAVLDETLRDKTDKSHLLFMAWAFADHLDKSTEWMFAYMSDFAQVEYEEAVEFVIVTPPDSRDAWYQCNPDWLNEMTEINAQRLKELEDEH